MSSVIWVVWLRVTLVTGPGNVTAGRFMTISDFLTVFIVGHCWVAAIVVGVYEPCKGRLVSVDNEQLVVSTSQESVDKHLTLLDPNYGTSPRICDRVFGARTIREDNDDLVTRFPSNDGFQPGDPVHQSVHIRLMRGSAVLLRVILSKPGHGNDDKMSANIESMVSKFKILPGSLELIWTG